MTESKDDRVKRLHTTGIETNDMIDKQFIQDKNLSECIRDIQILLDKWNLRPLERDIVIKMLDKYEKDRKLAAKSSNMFENLLDKTMKRFGSVS